MMKPLFHDDLLAFICLSSLETLQEPFVHVLPVKDDHHVAAVEITVDESVPRDRGTDLQIRFQETGQTGFVQRQAFTVPYSKESRTALMSNFPHR